MVMATMSRHINLRSYTLKIAVAGIGYVGLANAIMLDQSYQVTLLDLNDAKVDLINKHISPIKDSMIDEFLPNVSKSFKATHNLEEAYSDKDLIIIATPTNYDVETNSFDTSSIEITIKNILLYNKKTTILIKSTIPVGYVNHVRDIFKYDDIYFSPEFLREGTALYDCLNPSRIVIGGKNKKAKKIGKIFKKLSLNRTVPVIHTNASEAESIKLFANTYLAMRVAFFNELDTYACKKSLDTKDIIDGVCTDSRIGHFYNNPSFGYGGYCLPKDTKQLLSSYNEIPNNLMKAIVDSNHTRKEYIASKIKESKSKIVGIYRLVMKSNSDNFRESAILDVIELLKQHGQEMVIYEPLLKVNHIDNIPIVKSFKEFVNTSNLILANRVDATLKPYSEKIFSRSISNEN